MSKWVDLLDSKNQKFDPASTSLVATTVQAAVEELDASHMSELKDDTSPELGGNLATEGNVIQITDASSVLRGLLGDTSGGAVAVAYSDDGVYDANDGALVCAPGISELHGAVSKVLALADTEPVQVYAATDGSLFGVAPPDTGWQENDTDNGAYPLPTLATWVQLTGLQVTVPQDVTAGDRLDLIANVHIVNNSATRGGSVAIGFGYKGAQPVGAGEVFRIEPGFDGRVNAALSTTSHGGLVATDTIEVWAMRQTQDHAAFDPSADASTGALHELIVSVPGGGGTGEVNTGVNLPGGVGVYDGKVSTELQFRPLNAASSKITVTLNGSVIDLDAVITKADVGLGNVDNTADIDKPVSTAQQTALDGKLDDAANEVKDSHIDFGSGAGQVDADDIPDGSTKVMMTTAERTSLAGKLDKSASLFDDTAGFTEASQTITALDLSASNKVATSATGGPTLAVSTPPPNNCNVTIMITVSDANGYSLPASFKLYDGSAARSDAGVDMLSAYWDGTNYHCGISNQD